MTASLDAWLDAVRAGVARAEADAGPFARYVSVHPITGSTNDDVARAALEGAPEGYTVVAAEQTAGRGRRGASWHSPAAHGLYVSTLLRPDRWPVMRADRSSPASSLVTLMAGVAVVQAVRRACGAPVELKWPNDVMARTASAGRAGSPSRPEPSTSPVGPVLRTRPDDAAPAGPAPNPGPSWRKLAGILAEGASDAGVLRSVVLGMGINVLRSDAPADVAARMITLEELAPDHAGAPLALVADVIAALLAQLHEGVSLLATGQLARVRDAWTSLAPSVDGSPVRWHHRGMTHVGRACGIDESGALRVQVAASAEMLVHGGDVEWMLEGTHA